LNFLDLFLGQELIESLRKNGGFENIMDAAAAKLIGAGLAMLGTIGAGLGIGILVSGAVQGVARNPDAAGQVQTNMILGIAFAEAVAIYCLVVALLILFTG
jgi:ATP synthase F0 subunit c